ncbi:MAG: gfo/Idh/MocA family oxidoreductase, partial [Pseudothermotoga sp.]
AEKIETKAGWTFPSPEEDWVRGYPQEMKDFALAILGNKEPESDFELAKETTMIIYAAYLSAEKGVRIDL